MMKKRSDPTKLTDTQKARQNLSWYKYARDNGHLEYVYTHVKCEDFFFSEQWLEEEKRKLEKIGRPALTLNKIDPTLRAVFGEYIKNRADVTFVPASGEGRTEIAEAITKLYIHIGHNEKLDWKEYEVVQDGVIGGRGYYDVRIGYDDNLQGEVRVTVENPANVLPEPDATVYDPAGWNRVTITRWLDIQEIEFLYGKKKANLIRHMDTSDFEDYAYDHIERAGFAGKDRPRTDTHDAESDELTERTYRIIETQFKRIVTKPHFIDLRTGDFRAIPESWEQGDIDTAMEENPEWEIETLQTQEIRWRVSAGATLLHDGVSPYKYFTIVPFFPTFRRGRTKGLVQDILDPQNQYNKIRSQELTVINTTANSGYKVQRGSLSGDFTVDDLREQGAMPGVVIEYDGDPDSVEKLQPNQIPQGLDRASFKADEDIKEISGIGDSVRGLDRADVSGTAIRAKQTAAGVNLTGFFESLAYTRHLLAKRILCLVQEYYTEERNIYITRPTLFQETDSVTINEPTPEGAIRNDLTIGEYDVVITPAPVRDSYDQSQYEEAIRLLELGAPIPLDTVVEHSSLHNRAEIAQRMREIAGTDSPSEEERQLANQERELEMRTREADIMTKQANAELSIARARKVMSEIAGGDTSIDKLEKLMLDARKLDQDWLNEQATLSIRERALEQGERKLDLQERKIEKEKTDERSGG